MVTHALSDVTEGFLGRGERAPMMAGVAVAGVSPSLRNWRNEWTKAARTALYRLREPWSRSEVIWAALAVA